MSTYTLKYLALDSINKQIAGSLTIRATAADIALRITRSWLTLSHLQPLEVNLH